MKNTKMEEIVMAIHGEVGIRDTHNPCLWGEQSTGKEDTIPCPPLFG